MFAQKILYPKLQQTICNFIPTQVTFKYKSAAKTTRPNTYFVIDFKLLLGF